MNIFLIGPSRSGKTTLARRMVEAHPYLTAASASRWLRERLPSATVDELTSEATRVLRAHPDIARDHVRAQMASAPGGCVIEGIRNPIDFACLFDPRSDAVVFLNGPSATSFERDGVAAIRRIVLWQIGQGLLDESRADVLGFPTGYEQAWSNILEWCRNVLKSGFSKASVPSSSFVHVPLKVPFPAEVRMDFLYRDPARATEWAPCVVFAVSSYQGHLPTLRVLLDEGRTLYDYLPLHDDPVETAHQLEQVRPSAEIDGWQIERAADRDARHLTKVVRKRRGHGQLDVSRWLPDALRNAVDLPRPIGSAGRCDHPFLLVRRDRDQASVELLLDARGEPVEIRRMTLSVIEELVERPGNDSPVRGFVQDEPTTLLHETLPHRRSDLIILEADEVRVPTSTPTLDRVACGQIIERAARSSSVRPDHRACGQIGGSRRRAELS